MRVNISICVLLCALLMSACGPVIVETEPPYPSEHKYFKIPPGHLPPPGECRIWYPGKPPGHQPPPGDCAALHWRVPPGAWLIHRPAKNRDYFEVKEYHPRNPRVVIVIRFYEVGTGRLIREEKPH